ncbi:hypothetical protein Phi13:2_gp025 [Cellulophaga phage phi13:2]|uniref:Uncharacterized protein n=1 Tax=Cellulophaga phage phi13:2 TaxID=1328030 RepID=S0A4D2_9CAUD|nr:hypothetical protein Phi13:2_gp025 [Cellulophaga phage phi13:2]AGO49635.1 hypothetical protein Phi13:2_gp025 [Cellulophaga phage phi13:2]
MNKQKENKETETKHKLSNVLSRLHDVGAHFRLEDYEDEFVLSIIDRGIYPRIWSDNFADNQVVIIAETDDNLINRNTIHSKDWKERWYGETLDEVLYEAYEWLSSLNIEKTT